MIKHLPVVDFGATKVIFSKMGYRIGKSIGKGTYSKVCLALDKKGRKYACKIINKKSSGCNFMKKFLPRELCILYSINHTHIVRIYNVLELNKAVYIFMDYCKNGDLLEYLRNRAPLEEKETSTFFRQIIDAVHYLHSLDIAHRDLKCENIFLMKNNKIKIGDFGFAQWCRDQSGIYRFSDTFCGSTAYAAPEILQGFCYDPKLYDIWALGCILYIMTTATMPFDDSNIISMIKYQLTRKIRVITSSWVKYSKNLRLLQNALLEPDVIKRISIEQVMVHPWINANNCGKSGNISSVSDSLC